MITTSVGMRGFNSTAAEISLSTVLSVNQGFEQDRMAIAVLLFVLSRLAYCGYTTAMFSRRMGMA